MSSSQTTARLARPPNEARTVIVALTASAFAEHRERFLACGCDEFLGKPFRAEELFAILEHPAGLRLIRTGAAPPSNAALSAEEVAVRLAARPAAWRADLRAAVALGDFGRITTLVDRCEEQDAALGQVLAQWAYDYDLEAFSRALLGSERPPPASGEGANEPGPGPAGTRPAPWQPPGAELTCRREP